MYTVYMHTNIVNGKVYVGITRQRPERRWHGGNGYRDQPLFWNAIKKYGWSSFLHCILATVETQNEAFELEKHYILEYRSAERKFGYNISAGGMDTTRFSPDYRENLSVAKRKRKPHSEETKRKISEARKGKKQPPRSEESKKKLSEALRGRTRTPEHCANISKGKMGKMTGKDNPRARKVRCVETGVVYDCLLYAGKAVGVSHHNISAACRGRLQTSGGFHWEYV